ncbi:MAG: hypothetical protein JWP25_5023 [Bradyrhizobium sp.]|nr:hypothetical protein [Bradyrhizobium sp.]
MTALVRYEMARAALADARSVDEVKDIHDKAAAMAAYARMANDTQLEADASELRLRAERRLGVMIAAEKITGRLRTGPAPKPIGRDHQPIARVKLSDIGVTKDLSRRSQKVAGIAEQAFEAVVANVRQRIAEQSGRVSLDITAVDKKEKRANRERLLAGVQLALPKKKYGVIYADPEWRFEPYSRDTGMDRAPENHYPTSTVEAICARPVRDIAAPDCVLFLWATVPMLAEAFCVLDAWGFARFDRNPGNGFLEIDKADVRYVSSGSWTKYKPGAGIGMGHWFRVDHEILLVATRGNIPCPAKGDQYRSVFDVPASRIHSEKPTLVHELIESYFPNLPKIELNARRARLGWDCWGNEAPAINDSDRVTFDSTPSEPDHPILNTVSDHGELTGVIHGAPPDGLVGGASSIHEATPDCSLRNAAHKPGETEGAIPDGAQPNSKPGGAPSFSDFPELEIPDFLRRKRSAA